MLRVRSLHQRYYERLELELESLNGQFLLIRDTIYQCRAVNFMSIWREVVLCLSDRLEEVREELVKLEGEHNALGWRLQKELTEELMKECWISILETRSRILKYLPSEQGVLAS